MVLIEAKSERPVDVQAGNLHIRLAESAAEVRASQRLRYRVFCEEMTAKPTQEMAVSRREFDSYDDYCDHLLVFDRTRGSGEDAVVGTYRLMRRESALRRGRFYSIDEYDISPLIDYPGEILELGRSCVDRDYRSGSTMQLLWRGIAEYVFAYNIDVMFGCGSLPGADPRQHAMTLSYLYHKHLAPPALLARAVPSRYVDMNMVAPGKLDVVLARKSIPPLIKGYLRLGGYVGDGAVVDAEFGTTDVCIVVKTDLVTQKYYRHYIREDAPRGEDSA